MKKYEKKEKTNFNGESKGKHQKAKQNFLNTKHQKGNKGNAKWEDFESDF